ncbi:hypothetical protein Zm00014a_029331 [Zea mays]|nr:hypothetical protein Zm00014a_029331 [Zea mays]
MHGLMTQPLPF